MINDVKWVQAQRHASDWRHALDIAVRPLITFGAAAPATWTVLLRTPLNGGHIILSRRGLRCPMPDRSKAPTIIKSASLRYQRRSLSVMRIAIPSGCCFAPAPRMPKHIFAPFNASASGSTRRKASRCCKMRQMMPRFSRN